jgi:predicted amidophosphoribosyltransferase
VVCRGPGPALCGTCLRRTVPPPSTRVRDLGHVPALFAYEHHGARIVQALKYRDGRRLVAPLADGMARCWAEVAPAAPGLVVTWVPTSGPRRRTRGFDQSELLARAVARRLGATAGPLLRRRPGPAQTGLDRAAREAAAGYVATARTGAPVLLLDDVCTTGSTLRAASAALAATGSRPIGHVVVARTP